MPHARALSLRPMPPLRRAGRRATQPLRRASSGGARSQGVRAQGGHGKSGTKQLGRTERIRWRNGKKEKHILVFSLVLSTIRSCDKRIKKIASTLPTELLMELEARKNSSTSKVESCQTDLTVLALILYLLC